MPFAAALSEHPITTVAVGEVVGQVLEKVGTGPDLAVLFVTPGHQGALEDAMGVVRSVLDAAVTLACGAVSVAGPNREVEHEPGMSLWAGWFGPVGQAGDDPDRPARVVAASFEAIPDRTGFDLIGVPEPADLPFEPCALVLIADPFSFPVDALLAEVAHTFGPIPIVGGMASGGSHRGGSRLGLDGRVTSSGAVGAWLGPDAHLQTIVSQGCRPIGQPWVVTRSEGRLVHELAGQPPLERLKSVASKMTPDEINLINQGLHLGRVVDEHKAEFERGDFLVRNILGADSSTNAIVVGDELPVGTTVQYHVRDAATADEDLRDLLIDQSADAALLFTCNGRGIRFFGEPDHDAGVLADVLGDPPVAGCACAGELGPIGGRNFVHGFTASVVLFTEEAVPSGEAGG